MPLANTRQESQREAESLSRMMGNCHVRFLGEGDGATQAPLPDKSRKKGIGGFRLTGAIHVFEKSIQLPRLGTLRLKEKRYLPRNAKIGSATITEQAGRWYVSICVHEESAEPEPATGPVIGVDLGVKTLATVSDGREIANPKALRKRLKRLQRLSRWHSRKH